MQSSKTTTVPPHPVAKRMRMATHLRHTLHLAWPSILGQLGHVIIGNADTIMIGRLGSTELAAATLANAIFYLPILIGFGVCVAISPITSQAIGADRPQEEIGRILHQGVLFSLYLGIVLALALVGMTLLFPYLGQDPEVVGPAAEYLLILTISTFPFLFFLTYKHFIEGYELMLPGMVIMGFMVVLNIFLNWLFIYGNWGMPALGLNGAGWATLASRIVGTVILVAYVHRNPRFRGFGYFRQFWRHSRTHLQKIARIGLPSGMMYFFESGAFTAAVILAGRIGKDPQSAHQVAIQVAALAFMFYLGLAHASGIRVGHALGRGDGPEMRRAGLAGLIAGLGCVALFVTLMTSLSEVIPGWYIQDEKVIAIATPLLLIAALFQLFDGIQGISAGILRGMSDVRIPTGITFVAYWAIGIPGAWFLGEYLNWGISGIWYGLTIGLLFSAVALTLRFLYLSRIK
ncbi:MAG: MATE family efflux transporter [Bacteroidota bacterium]